MCLCVIILEKKAKNIPMELLLFLNHIVDDDLMLQCAELALKYDSFKP